MGLYLSRYLVRYSGRPRAVRPSSSLQDQRRRPRPERPVLYGVRPGCDSAGGRRAVAAQAWRQAPCSLPYWLRLNPELSYATYNYVKQRLWIAREPQLQSLMRVQVNHPVRPGSLYKCPPQKCPDPCAKKKVLKALRQCTKGKRKLEEPLWFEAPNPRKRKSNPETRPSAFKPVVRNGVTPSFVPRPGMVSRSVCSLASSTWRRKTNLGMPASLPLAFPVCCPTCHRSHASPGYSVIASSGELGAAVAQLGGSGPFSSPQGPPQEGLPALQNTCPLGT